MSAAAVEPEKDDAGLLEEVVLTPRHPPAHLSHSASSLSAPVVHENEVGAREVHHASSTSALSDIPPPPDPSRFAEHEPASAAATPTTSAGAGESDSLRTPLLSGVAAGSAAPPRRPTTNERCALFDLDLTLLDVNTGRLWVEKEFREGKIPFQLYLLSIYWFAKYAAGFGVDAQEVAKEAMSLYGGQSSEAMRLDVETFWARECAARVRPGAVAALAMHRARGERCILCTASWQHIAASARRQLALDGAICSVIEVGEDGKFTGGVKNAYGEGKLARTVEWAAAEGVDLANCTFYTDSYTDTRLMEAVGTPVAVCPDRRLADAAHRKGWKIEEWGEAPPAPTKPSRYACGALFGLC